MNNIKKLSMRWTLFCTLLMAFSLSLTSCSDNDEKNAETNPDPVIEKLETLISEMKELKDNSPFGLLVGMYPGESKVILENAISGANRDILLIRYQEPKPSQSEKERFVEKANSAITKFESTKRTEDAYAEPAYLYVNGNNSGYIDFGYSPEYSTFGETGNQSFTIEFWVKINAYGKEDNSIMLSTFVDADNADPKYRTGWMMYSRNRNILRFTAGVKNTDSNNLYNLWEPNLNYTGLEEWVHYAIVYSDKGLDGNPTLRGKLYKNAVRAVDLNISESYNKYNSEMADKLQIPMTAFARFTKEKKLIEGFSGYMRKIRIWKTAKSDQYIQDSKEGITQIDPTDPDLVCGWDLDKIASDNDNIPDITGRHKAKLVGDYKWEPR